MKIDKLFLEVDDVDAAAERLSKDHGLESLPAGNFPLGGSTNRLIPAGSASVVLAPAPPATQPNIPEGVVVITRAGWVVRVEDVASVAERLGLKVRKGMGATSFKFAGVEQMARDPWLPVFVQYDMFPAMPSLGTKVHGIEWFELQGDEEPIKEWVDSEIPVRCLAADSEVAPIRTIALDTDAGEIILRHGEI